MGNHTNLTKFGISQWFHKLKCAVELDYGEALKHFNWDTYVHFTEVTKGNLYIYFS